MLPAAFSSPPLQTQVPRWESARSLPAGPGCQPRTQGTGLGGEPSSHPREIAPLQLCTSLPQPRSSFHPCASSMAGQGGREQSQGPRKIIRTNKPKEAMAKYTRDPRRAARWGRPWQQRGDAVLWRGTPRTARHRPGRGGCVLTALLLFNTYLLEKRFCPGIIHLMS